MSINARNKVVTPYGGKRNPNVFVLLFLASLVILVAEFAPLLLRLHFSSDSYHLIADQHTTWYLQCGRYTFWLFSCFFDRMGINLVLAQRYFIAFCIVMMAISSALLADLYAGLCGLKGNLKSTFLVLPATLVWGNVFVEDWILFPEVAGMIALGAISLTLAIRFSLKGESVSSILASFAFLFISLGCYQSLVGSYVAAVVIGAILDSRDSLNGFWKKALIGILLGVACAVSNVVILKRIALVLGDSGRGSSFSLPVMLSNCYTLAVYQLKLFLNADGLLRAPAMQILELGLLLLLASVFRRSFGRGVAYIGAFVVALAASYAPHYIEANIILSPRSNVAVWMAFGCILMALLCECLLDDCSCGRGDATAPVPSARAKTFGAAVAALIAFMAVNAGFMWDIAYDVYASNVQDRQYAQQISQKIRDYEHETGNTVSGIGIVGDAHSQTTYPETRYHVAELGRRIVNCSYANVEMINYVGGLNLQTLTVSAEEKASLFGDEDWSCVSLDEQLIFVGDKAYLALY